MYFKKFKLTLGENSDFSDGIVFEREFDVNVFLYDAPYSSHSIKMYRSDEILTCDLEEHVYLRCNMSNNSIYNIRLVRMNESYRLSGSYRPNGSARNVFCLYEKVEFVDEDGYTHKLISDADGRTRTIIISDIGIVVSDSTC